MKRATPAERREKKQEKKRFEKERRKEENKDRRKKHDHRRKGKEEATDAADDKEIKTVTPFVHGAKRSFQQANEGVDMSSKMVSRKKKDKQKVFEEMIESRDGKTSRASKFINKPLKPQPTLN